MCLNIPYKVIKIEKNYAIVEFNKKRKKALIIDKKPKVGDYVFLKNGVIIEIIDSKKVEKSFKEMEKLLNISF